MTDTADFFRGLSALSNFSEVASSENYTPLPDDWILLLTDVKGSTQAIRDGHYKNVNMVGAACIMGILNIAENTDIPYVFGGDGATIAIPPNLKSAAIEALVQIRELAQTAMGLTLRLGVIPVTAINELGLSVDVLKYEISNSLFLAMFSGGGLMEADKLLKDDSSENPFIIPLSQKPDSPPDLEGLSCRWEPLASRNGQIVSLLANAPLGSKEEKTEIYRKLLQDLMAVLGQEVERFRPNSNKNLVFRWPPKGLWTEAKLTAAGQNVIKTYLNLCWQSFIQFVLEKTGRKAGSYDAPLYRKELLANTDFQRFDDMIRLVLDCTPDQITKIQKILSGYYEESKIAYGLHLSDTALMTCLVFNLAESAHLHFVDGGDGGFAFAATHMKKQLAEFAAKQ